MELVVNTIQKNIDNSNYHNNGNIMPADNIAHKSMETSKANEETSEYKSDKNNHELITTLLKDVSGRIRSEYTYHKEVNRISIKVVNEDTEEVIREIPPEKSIEILKQLMKIEGLFVDEMR